MTFRSDERRWEIANRIVIVYAIVGMAAGVGILLHAFLSRWF